MGQLLPSFDKTKSLRHEKSELKICHSGKGFRFENVGTDTKAMAYSKYKINFSPETKSWHTECC